MILLHSFDGTINTASGKSSLYLIPTEEITEDMRKALQAKMFANCTKEEWFKVRDLFCQYNLFYPYNVFRCTFPRFCKLQIKEQFYVDYEY